MLLYNCPGCGHWQDLALADYINNKLARIFTTLGTPPTSEKPLDTSMYTCSKCSTLMVLVDPGERISVIGDDVVSTSPISIVKKDNDTWNASITITLNGTDKSPRHALSQLSGLAYGCSVGILLSMQMQDQFDQLMERCGTFTDEDKTALLSFMKGRE